MKLDQILDEIKLELTGLVLEMEINDEDDTTLKQVVKKAIREISRYWDETTLVEMPFASCIGLENSELSNEKTVSIVKVYHTKGHGTVDGGIQDQDPLYMQQWLMFSNGGTMYNVNDYVLNYSAWTHLQRIRNTISTELSFTEDRHNNKLYINGNASRPSTIAIEYIPNLMAYPLEEAVEKIKSEYWIDVLIRLSVALTKIVLGRIRTRFTQSNALWTQDGERLLDEGNNELKELREVLRTNSNLIFGID